MQVQKIYIKTFVQKAEHKMLVKWTRDGFEQKSRLLILLPLDQIEILYDKKLPHFYLPCFSFFFPLFWYFLAPKFCQ